MLPIIITVSLKHTNLTGRGDILTKDPITNNNFELIYKTRDIDFTLIFTSNETGNVYVKTDVVPGGPGLYLYNFSYRNIRFPLEIYI